MNKNKILFLGFLLITAISLSPAGAGERVSIEKGAVDVYFTPQEIALYLVNFIDKSQNKVWAYNPMPGIVRSVIQAKARGLDVRVILDSSQITGKRSTANLLKTAGVPVWINSRYSMRYNFVICDDDRVGFGSSSFSETVITGRKGKTSGDNFNLFTGMRTLSKQYSDEFERLVAESSRY